MKQLDVFYRALIDYRKQTEIDYDCGHERKAIVSADPELDIINTVKNICTVEEDWILEIEKGLVFIEKAINEARQHILTNGEVIPIEKVKRVSKDSVKHLAKHSDFITREQQKETLTPEKLYIVERLTDYAVYENKFLYMLLDYLKNFISSKYSKILELSNTFNCSVSINKTISVNKRKTVFQLKIADQRRDDQFLKENNALQPILTRIDNTLKTVMFLLSTPLIVEVAKVPMLKPPITKTNVLKMNQNFKGAVNLYDFVRAYDKPGYSVEKLEEKINPFPDDTADEFAELIMLASFLTYKHGMGINEALKNAYNLEEISRKNAEAQQRKQQILLLKSRIDQSENSLLEYMLLLEKENKSLEANCLQLEEVRQENLQLKSEITELNNNVMLLSDKAENLQSEILLINQQHAQQISVLKDEHIKQIADINELNSKEKAQLTLRFNTEMQTLNAQHEKAITLLNQEYKIQTQKKDNIILQLEEKNARQLTEFNQKMEETTTEFTYKISNIENEANSKIATLEQLNTDKSLQCELLNRENAITQCRINALRKEYNLISEDEDFTSKVTFDELEHQYMVFKNFFKEEWKKTKKNIRRQVLDTKNGNQDNADETV